MANVILKSIKKYFPGNPKPAVVDFNLEVQDREFVVLVGPSGCGKSTTLRMVAGLEEISEGEIYIGDRLVNDVPPKDRDIAMVFQNYALYPHMTVYDNMAFGLKLRKYPKKEIDDRVKEAAEILGIHDLLNRKPKALSGGQRQRVAVGRAIVRKPKVFLFDEPLSNLDAKLRVQMRAEISKLHNRLQATMIYVTHDQVEAMTMGNRIVVMNQGYIQQIADPITIYDSPSNKFVAGFIGSPAMNFIEGRLDKKPDGVYFNEGSFEVRIPDIFVDRMNNYINKDVVMGIRPENIGDKNFETEFDSKHIVSAAVEVVEPIGAEAYIYLVTGKSSFVARFDTHDQVKVGQTIETIFHMNKAHIFDKDKEITIV